MPPLRTSSASLRSAPIPIPSGLRPSPLEKGSRPLKGKAYGRPHGAAPTAENGPGALAQPSQAQLWNRSSGNFCKPRAQWPGRNRRKPLKFCAPEMFCLVQGVTPVNGGPGGGRHGGRGGNAVPADCAHPLAALWFLSARAERNSPPGRRNTPLRTTNPIRNLSPHPPQCEHWGTFPPGGRLNESGRRNLPCK